jgi:hypothetical protein
VSAKHGVAQFAGLSIDMAGTRTLTVSGPGLANPGTASFQMTISPVVTTTKKPSTATSYAAGQDFTLSTMLRGVASSPVDWTGMGRLVDANGVELPTTSVLTTNGSLTLTVGGLTAGTYMVHVVYDGDTNHLATVSPTFKLTVGSGTTLTVTPLTTQVAAGGTVTLNVQVGSSRNAPARTGAVQLMENGVVVDTQSLGGNSQATFSINPTVGTHTYTVVYGGDLSFIGSTSSAVSVTAGTATKTSVRASKTSVGVGDLVNLTVTGGTAASGAPARTGSVQLFDNGVAVGMLTLDSDSKVSFPVNPTLGKHTYTVVYAGDGIYRGSTSSAVKVTVGKEATLTVVTPSGTQSTFGGAITLDVAVGGANGTSVTRTGTVLLKDGNTVLGVAALGTNSHASFIVTPSGGTHAYKAVYQGDTSFKTSTSAAATVAVAKDPTIVTTSSDSQIRLGDLFRLSAQVVPYGTATAARTGSLVLQENGSTLMTLKLDSNSAATFVFTPTAGTHHYTVTYKGDGNYVASAPTGVDLTVGSAATTTLITTSATQVGFGSAFTISAQVTSLGGTGTPGGTVTLRDGGVTVDSQGLTNGSYVFSVNPTVGTHTFTVVYSSSDTTTFTNSTSSAASLTVTKAATTTTVTPSALTVDAGSPLTLDVDVAAIGGATASCTGSVTLLDGSTPKSTLTLDGSGHASFVVNPTVGDHVYKVSYAGDGNFAVSTSSTVTVAAGINTTTTVVASGSSLSVGDPLTLTVNVNPASGTAARTGNVQLLDNGTVVATKALDAGSQAVFTVTSTLGNHNYTVSYAGDTTYRTSTSTAVAVSVAQEATTTTLTSHGVTGSILTLERWTRKMAPRRPGRVSWP